jgi:hypothetical protein
MLKKTFYIGFAFLVVLSQVFYEAQAADDSLLHDLRLRYATFIDSVIAGI